MIRCQLLLGSHVVHFAGKPPCTCVCPQAPSHASPHVSIHQHQHHTRGCCSTTAGRPQEEAYVVASSGVGEPWALYPVFSTACVNCEPWAWHLISGLLAAETASHARCARTEPRDTCQSHPSCCVRAEQKGTQLDDLWHGGRRVRTATSSPAHLTIPTGVELVRETEVRRCCCASSAIQCGSLTLRSISTGSEVRIRVFNVGDTTLDASLTLRPLVEKWKWSPQTSSRCVPPSTRSERGSLLAL